jgi:hypothetical protein
MTEVASSAAAEVGLRHGDVIQEVNRNPSRSYAFRAGGTCDATRRGISPSTKMPHNPLRCFSNTGWARIAEGFAVIWPLARHGWASDPVLLDRLARLLQPSFRLHLAARPLRFCYTFTSIKAVEETFTPELSNTLGTHIKNRRRGSVPVRVCHRYSDGRSNVVVLRSASVMIHSRVPFASVRRVAGNRVQPKARFRSDRSRRFRPIAGDMPFEECPWAFPRFFQGGERAKRGYE